MKRTFATISRLESNVLPYDKLDGALQHARKLRPRPFTLMEKIFLSHISDSTDIPHLKRGESYIRVRPDRLAMQDASAQMAILQFISAGLPRTALPTTVHCDHLIVAKTKADEDLKRADIEHKEVYEFLASSARKFGMGFWKPGSGIIHQIVLENYAFPGGFMVGTDSHTPNAGGLGMIAIGVGGADAVDVMAHFPFEVKYPKVFGIHLTGSLPEWTTPKDVILKVASLLSVKGGTGAVLEYFGPGIDSLSCTGMSTICNMGAEVGASTSLFPFTSAMYDYLTATDRKAIADEAARYSANFCADEGCEYDEIFEIDLSTLEPQINGPFTPDLGHGISSFPNALTQNKWPAKLSASLIGSCTNSSYEDLTRCASLVTQARANGKKLQIPLLLTPGSEQIRKTLEVDGVLDIFEEAGATILANACGPCAGMWTRETIGENSIVSSYNRNFSRRNDGNEATHNFLTSPELATAFAFAGTLDFNPASDHIDGFRFQPPSGTSLPSEFIEPQGIYDPPLEDGSDQLICIPEDSNRLQLLPPFQAWNGKDIRATVLIKVRGKCTTDHISMAGPWLKLRGHLPNISENTLIGATNDENGKQNEVWNVILERWGPVPATARDYKDAGKDWIVIGGENYGEGSSRELAALQPRYLGARAVIALSFARIHETNLKKQGLLPLTFQDPNVYSELKSSDDVEITNLTELKSGKPVMCKCFRDGTLVVEFWVNHTMNDDQIAWFKAGSALNHMRNLQET